MSSSEIMLNQEEPELNFEGVAPPLSFGDIVFRQMGRNPMDKKLRRISRPNPRSRLAREIAPLLDSRNGFVRPLHNTTIPLQLTKWLLSLLPQFGGDVATFTLSYLTQGDVASIDRLLRYNGLKPTTEPTRPLGVYPKTPSDPPLPKRKYYCPKGRNKCKTPCRCKNCFCSCACMCEKRRDASFCTNEWDEDYFFLKDECLCVFVPGPRSTSTPTPPPVERILDRAVVWKEDVHVGPYCGPGGPDDWL